MPSSEKIRESLAPSGKGVEDSKTARRAERRRRSRLAPLSYGIPGRLHVRSAPMAPKSKASPDHAQHATRVRDRVRRKAPLLRHSRAIGADPLKGLDVYSFIGFLGVVEKPRYHVTLDDTGCDATRYPTKSPMVTAFSETIGEKPHHHVVVRMIAYATRGQASDAGRCPDPLARDYRTTVRKQPRRPGNSTEDNPVGATP